MAREKSQRDRLSEDDYIRKAGARCECTGQCGHNHNWEAAHRAQRCGAVHGLRIARKKDNPSSWVSVQTQRPAYESYYDMKSTDVVWLAVQRVGTKKLVMCQFCFKHFRELRG